MKRLLTALTIASTIAFAMPALAAPVLTKTKLKMPAPPSATLLKSIEWTVSYESGKTPAGGTLYTKKIVRGLPTHVDLTNEVTCGGNTYRQWTVYPDNTQVAAGKKFYLGEGTNFMNVFEAESKTSRKWMMQPQHFMSTGRTWFLLGCSKADLVVGNDRRDDPTRWEQFRYLVIPFSNFTSQEQWKDSQTVVLRDYNGEARAHYLNESIRVGTESKKTIIPGIMTINDPLRPKLKIQGTSQVAVLDKNGFKMYSPPWFRDLSAVTEHLELTFYRFDDGYGVRESKGFGSLEPDKFYRIHDGESAYTLVSGFPELVQMVSYSFLDGYVVYTPHGKVLVHGGLPTSGITISSWTVEETNESVTIRYVIMPSKGTGEFWQAIIQK